MKFTPFSHIWSSDLANAARAAWLKQPFPDKEGPQDLRFMEGLQRHLSDGSSIEIAHNLTVSKAWKPQGAICNLYKTTMCF